MVYSLLNASALGFDVLRRPAAQRLADVLLTALTAQPALLWELAAAHPAAQLPRQEQREWLVAAALTRAVRAAAPQPVVQVHAASPPRWGAVADGVARLSLGKPGELDRLIAQEMMGPGSAATEVPQHVYRLAADALAEAAVAEWMTGPADPPSAAHAALDLARAECPAPPPADLGPGRDRLVDLLAALPRTPQEWEARRPALQGRGALHEWAEAMHDASWAIELTGRARPAAIAQLSAAAHLAGTGLCSTELASWAWNPISALVAAAVVGDLLPEDTSHTLASYDSAPPPASTGTQT